MALPLPPDRYDVPNGAHVALRGDGQVLYRRLAGAEPGVKDFRSDRDRGKEPAPTEPWIEHAGLSVFDTSEAAVSVVAQFPVFIAAFRVPADQLCSVAKTGPLRHYTVWGPPKLLLDGVVQVYRQNYASGTLGVHS